MKSYFSSTLFFYILEYVSYSVYNIILNMFGWNTLFTYTSKCILLIGIVFSVFLCLINTCSFPNTCCVIQF